MNSSSPSSTGIGIGTVIGISIVVGLIVFAISKYFADKAYQPVDYEYERKTYQPVGDYITSDIYNNDLKSLKDSTDMLSQQVKNSINVSANLLRSVGFIRISPNTVLVSPSTSGLTTGFGGLPSCIGKGSPLIILSGSPAFINKIMAYKDAKPSSTFQEAVLTAVKSIGTESFRWRRRQDTAVQAAVIVAQNSPYQLQIQNNLIKNLMSVDVASLSADDKKLLSSFVSKYVFMIESFDQTTGYPVLNTISDMFAGKTITTVSPSSNSYQTIINDIYHYNPHLLNSC